MKYYHVAGDRWDVSQYQVDALPVAERAGYFVIQQSSPAWYDSAVSRMVEGRPKLVKGQYVQQWVIEPLSPEQINAARLAKAESVKAQALDLLNTSDYMVIPDRFSMYDETRKGAIVAYREALREVVRGNSESLPDKP